MDIMTYMFDEENNKRLFGLEQWKLGKEEGEEKGRKEGQKTGQNLIAMNLLDMHMDISFIEQATGLSKAEILNLKPHRRDVS